MGKHTLDAIDRWHRYCELDHGVWIDTDMFPSVCPVQNHPEHGHYQRQAWPAVNMAGERVNWSGEVRPKGLHVAPE